MFGKLALAFAAVSLLFGCGPSPSATKDQNAGQTSPLQPTDLDTLKGQLTGKTKSEALAMLGQPTSISDGMWDYVNLPVKDLMTGQAYTHVDLFFDYENESKTVKSVSASN